MDINYKEIIMQSQFGYAYHEVICDKKGNPVDYTIIDINPTYEQFLGLKANDVLGKRITEILPNIKNGATNWIKEFGEVAVNGGEKEFEEYSEIFKKYFRIRVFSPKKGYFVTSFCDSYKNACKI